MVLLWLDHCSGSGYFTKDQNTLIEQSVSIDSARIDLYLRHVVKHVFKCLNTDNLTTLLGLAMALLMRHKNSN